MTQVRRGETRDVARLAEADARICSVTALAIPAQREPVEGSDARRAKREAAVRATTGLPIHIHGPVAYEHSLLS